MAMQRMRSFNKNAMITNLGMNQMTIGDHEITYNDIFNLVNGIFRKQFTIKQPNPHAAWVLLGAKGIKVKDKSFKQVKFGDITVLIYEENIGVKYRDYIDDFAIVNNRPVLFIFSNELTDPNVPRKNRVEKIYRLFSDLVQLFMIQEYYNIVGSIYATIIDYAPIVMTVRLVETFYNHTFNMEKDYDEELYPDSVSSWFGQDALDIIHTSTDAELLEFGLMVDHVTSNRGY